MLYKEGVYIVIPAYNEGSAIGDVLRDIKRIGFRRIIVVDDGSEDNTSDSAKKEKVVVIKHILNRGKGAAVATGLEVAKILKAKVVITIDGDGQHDPKDIKKLLKKIIGGYEVVLGSRFLGKNKIPIFKRIVNQIGNFITWFFFGFWVSDSQSGFRAYSKKALNVIDTKTDRYEFDSEVIKEIRRNKLKFSEVPITVRYTKYSQNKYYRQSFINGIKTLFKLVLNS